MALSTKVTVVRPFGRSLPGDIVEVNDVRAKYLVARGLAVSIDTNAGPRAPVLLPPEPHWLSSLTPEKPRWYPAKVKTPKISVLMPVFNSRKDWLDLAIESALANKKLSVEVILVDDGSYIPVEMYDDDRIGLLRLPYNRGISGATIAGVPYCSGTYIRRLDADDELLDGCLKKQMDLMIRYKALLSHGQMLVDGFGHQGADWPQNLRMKELWDGDQQSVLDLVKDSEYPLLAGPTAMWLRDWCRPLPPENQLNADDQWLWRMACEKLRPGQIIYCDFPVLRYTYDDLRARRIAETSGLFAANIQTEISCLEISAPIKVVIADPLLESGGAQWMAILLAKIYDKDKIQVTFLTEERTDLTAYAEQIGLDVRYASGDWDAWLRKQLDEIKPDIIDDLWRWKSREIVYDGPWKVVAHAQGMRPMWLKNPEALKKTQKVICVSQAVAGVLPEYGEKLKVILNPVDTVEARATAYLRPVTRACLEIPENAIVAAWVGRMSAREKDTQLLYEIIPALEQAGIYTLVIGDYSQRHSNTYTSDRGRWSNFVKAHTLTKWVNFCQPWDIFKLLVAADIYFSTSNSEGCALALLEAMACACIPVITDAGGNPEALWLNAGCTKNDSVVRGTYGSVCQIGRSSDLAKEIRKYAGMSSEDRRDLGHQIQVATAAKFDVRVCAMNHAQVYKEIAHECTGADCVTIRQDCEGSREQSG